MAIEDKIFKKTGSSWYRMSRKDGILRKKRKATASRYIGELSNRNS